MNKIVNPRRFARVKPTGRVSNAAKIVTGPKDPMIDCALVDFSPGGACLDIGSAVALPLRFELIHGGINDIRGRVFGHLTLALSGETDAVDRAIAAASAHAPLIEEDSRG